MYQLGLNTLAMHDELERLSISRAGGGLFKPTGLTVPKPDPQFRTFHTPA